MALYYDLPVYRDVYEFILKILKYNDDGVNVIATKERYAKQIPHTYQ